MTMDSPRMERERLETQPGFCMMAHEPLRVRLTELESDVRDHEQRVRAIEALRWQLAGFASAAAAVGALLGRVVSP